MSRNRRVDNRVLAEKAERRLGVGGVCDGVKWCEERLALLCANNNDAGEAPYDGENVLGELENDEDRCDMPPSSCEDEKGMEEDENLDDDMGALRSSGSTALTGGGEASRDFSSQKNLHKLVGPQIKITTSHSQVFTWTQLQHEKQPFPGLQRLMQRDNVLVYRQRKMDRRFKQLCFNLFLFEILFAQTFQSCMNQHLIHSP